MKHIVINPKFRTHFLTNKDFLFACLAYLQCHLTPVPSVWSAFPLLFHEPALLPICVQVIPKPLCASDAPSSNPVNVPLG